MNHPDAVLDPARQLPVLGSWDVVVVGGGTAGVVAAVAAARTGARVVLIERNGFVGGSATATYNTNLSSSHDSDGHRVMGGVGWEAIRRLVESGSALMQFAPGQRTPAHIFPEGLKWVALQMLHEAGVDLLLQTWFADVWRTASDGPGRISGAIVESKAGRQVVLAKAFVDASADGDVAARAGFPFELLPPEQRYTTSLDLTVANINARRLLQWAKENRDQLGLKWVADPDAVKGLQPLYTIPIGGPRETHHPDGSVTREHQALAVKLMVRRSVCRVQGHLPIDALDPRELSRAEHECRRQAMEAFDALRRDVPGFEDAFVVGQSPLGVRETRRIEGDYRISIDDVLACRRFDDVVGLNCRAIDRHTGNDTFYIKQLDGNHDIPLRSLRPRGADNLLIAGRCLSCDQESHASLRGGGTCMITGHAAGTAASLAAMRNEGNVRTLDVTALQETLRQQGAVLGTPRLPAENPGRELEQIVPR